MDKGIQMVTPASVGSSGADVGVALFIPSQQAAVGRSHHLPRARQKPHGELIWPSGRALETRGLR